MNKRIKELATQAREYTEKYNSDRGNKLVAEEWTEVYNQKFAELMLVEFTETVKQTATLVAQTGFNDGLSIEEVNKQVNGALRVLDVMRKRFGVEE